MISKEIILEVCYSDITELIKGYSVLRLIEIRGTPKLYINQLPFILNKEYKISKQTIITRNKNAKSFVVIIVELA